MLGMFLLSLSTIGGICHADDIEYINKEIIRNGGFEEKLYTGWFTNISSTTNAAKEGDRGMESYEYSQERDDFFLQNLMLPSQLQSAAISFDYRTLYQGTEPVPPSINMQVYLAKSKGFDTESLIQDMPSLTPMGTLYNDTYNQAIDWQKISVDIDDVLIAEMQAAHDAGEFVFLVFLFHSDDNTWMTSQDIGVNIDNVSFLVNGTQQVPPMKGKIAFYEYIEADPDQNKEEQRIINILDPNTRQVNTILNSTAIAGMYLKWKPDGTEIAFTNDQEALFSPYYNDIYTIRPDGSRLRKVTNQPSQGEIKNGNFPHVTLTGKIANNATYLDPTKIPGPTTITLCVRGALDPITLTLGVNEEVSFTIPDVAVLDDPNVFQQPAIIYWSNNFCHMGLEYEEILAGTVSDSTVDLGTLSFEAAECVEMPGDHYLGDISWTNDGSAIGTVVNAMGGLLKFDSDSNTDLFGKKMTSSGFLPGNMEWSPIDDRYLYVTNMSDDIYLSQNGIEPELLIEKAHERVSPAWLLDGSGFIFVKKGKTISDNIYYFDLETKEIQQLTFLGEEKIVGVSVSADNRYIVFNRCNSSDVENRIYELWIMDRLNPVEMWQVTEGGDHLNPDWSRVDVTVEPDNDDDNNSGKNSTGGGGGGGGGCFTRTLQQP